MRIDGSHASQQYRKNAVAERPQERVRTEPQASVKTTTFGFRLGKFGLDFESSNTTLDPSLSRDVREQRRQQQSFDVDAEIESLRATVGSEGASFRDRMSGTAADRQPTAHQRRAGLAAYVRNTEDILPPPGNMLAAVV